ncbi:MAG: hypothetical protein U5L11_01025 [Arhodomonas sp.]|nr:hypothetical protein [Arhodomonas sp.]
MLDHEFTKRIGCCVSSTGRRTKDKLDEYYQFYEERFEDADRLTSVFKKTTGEIQQLLPDIVKTRWRKKSDFYTLFLSLAVPSDDFPLASDVNTETTLAGVSMN